MEPEIGPQGQPPEAANDGSGHAPAGEAGADLKAELEAARRKAAENYDLYLRARAELENARRRSQEEIAKVEKYAIESFAEALVPVADSLERALEANAADPVKLREGVQITLRQLLAAFEKARLTEINPVGQKFDPYRHQAVSTVPLDQAGGAGPNQVVEVLQKGWMIADRVLRPALVTVSQGT
ncbi:MAG TPA: nucleotide exchange factor GrpE [Burkholderiaceae bacterium]|nr:nucleotide exchange factor GrpE [Burkholderiaceae bacterium]